MSQTRTADSELDGPQCDPLEIYQGLVRSLGLTMTGRRTQIKRDSILRYNGYFYEWRGWAPLMHSSVDVQLWYPQYHQKTQADPSLESFVSTLDDRVPGSPARKDFHHLRHPLSVFGDYWKGFDIFFIFGAIHTDNTDRLGYLIYRQVLKLQCFENRFFLQKNETYIRKESGLHDMYSDFPGFNPTSYLSRSNDWESNFNDGLIPKEGMLEFDFRPFLHRTLEYLAGVPSEQWHDPRQYLKPQADEPTQLLEHTLALLFSLEERDKLRASMDLRRGFPSIPSLNLGLVTMPAPGARDVVPDYLAQGGQLLIEALTPQLGRQDATALVEQKFLNYFLHHTPFQRSRSGAQDLLETMSRMHTGGTA